MNNFCGLPQQIVNTTSLYILGEIIAIALPIFLMIKVFNMFKDGFFQFLFVLFLLIYVLIVPLLGGIFGFWYVATTDDNRPTGYYDQINAAVKNTCFLDPKRINCPTTAQGVIGIEEGNFSDKTKNAHLTYQYYPNSNDYTLIIRDNNYILEGNRAAVFDSRLPKTPGYKNVDFYDASIVPNCDGTFRITNPPPLSGPWNKIN